MKEKFSQLIIDTVKPLLKANDFTKKGLNFYRKRDDLIFLFNFQNSQGNSFNQTKFYINCGIHSVTIDKIINKTELLEPKEYECYFRRRISSIVKSDVDGYIITTDTDLLTLRLTITKELKTVVSKFDDINTTQDLTHLMSNENGLDSYRELFKFLLLTENRTVLKCFVKHLYNTFGNERRWTLLESNLNDALQENKKKGTITDILHDQ